MPVRVLVVDDSTLVRCIVAGALACPTITVCAMAADGADALQKLDKFQPDVVVLDLEMPNVDGVEILRTIHGRQPRVRVIVFSAVSPEVALSVLQLGASEVLSKPEALTDAVLAQLKAKVLSVGLRDARGAAPIASVMRDATQLSAPSSGPLLRLPRKREPPRIIVIGSSTGGPDALEALFRTIEPGLSVPIVIVQHMPPVFTKMLAERLDKCTRLTVREASEGDKLQPGHVYLAPGDHHLSLVTRGAAVHVQLNQEPPENSVRPAVDVLFRSAAAVYGSHVLAIVLTGMGSDGTKGAQVIAAAGGDVVVQDEATSVVWGMPGFISRAKLARAELPLDQIAFEVNRLVNGTAQASPPSPTLGIMP